MSEGREMAGARPAGAGEPDARPDPRAASVWTLPNALGLARIVATPLVMALLLVDGAGTDLAAAVVFAAAGMSDFVDGRIARARNQVSPLGVFLDLAADKVLVAGVLIAMVQAALVPAWIVATILVRELVVQAVRQLAAAENVVIGARWPGKAKTLGTLGGMLVLLLAADARSGGPLAVADADVLAVIGFWMLVLATALTVVSGAFYLRAAYPLLGGRGPRG